MRGVDGAASVVWVGSRTDLDPVTLATVPQGGFVTANATATAPIGRGLLARVRVENLADRRYQEIRGYPAPRRRVLLGLQALVH
jgi:outer membrane cobalamin receptor